MSVEAVVEGVAEAVHRRRGEVKDELAEELLRLAELLFRQAVVDELLELPQGGAQGEMPRSAFGTGRIHISKIC